MALTLGEQYTVFLLLTTQKGATRQYLEGSLDAAGTAITPAQPASSAAALLTRTKTAFTKLGIPAAHFASMDNLLLPLFDPAGRNNVSTDQAIIAGILGLDYSGVSCPVQGAEAAMLTGIKSQFVGR